MALGRLGRAAGARPPAPPQHALAVSLQGSTLSSMPLCNVTMLISMLLISRPSHVASLAAAGADGAIVASALVDVLGDEGRNVEAMAALVRRLRAATARST